MHRAVGSFLFLVFVSLAVADPGASMVAPLRSSVISNSVPWIYCKFSKPPADGNALSAIPVKASFSEITPGCFVPGSILCLCVKNVLFNAMRRQLLCPPRTLHLCLMRHEANNELILTSDQIFGERVNDNEGQTVSMEVDFEERDNMDYSDTLPHMFQFQLGNKLTSAFNESLLNKKNGTSRMVFASNEDVAEETIELATDGFPILYRFVSNNDQCSAMFNFGSHDGSAARKRKYRNIFNEKFFEVDVRDYMINFATRVVCLWSVLFVKVMMLGLYVYKLDYEK